MSATVDRNNLAFWFPLIEQAGLPVPRTRIVQAEGDLSCLLDGESPSWFDNLIQPLRDAGDEFGWPCFLRTGHGSGKHEWSRTCFVEHPEALPANVCALVEWSHTVDMMGLPTATWAIREMIPTRALFHAFDGFPVTREFRFFVRDGAIEHWQPYWPEEAVAEGRPDDPEWEMKLAMASQAIPEVGESLAEMARTAAVAVGGGYWSVDLLQASDGGWWVTDMALGDQSFRYDYVHPEGAG